LGRSGPAAEPIAIRKFKGQTKPSLVGGDGVFEPDTLSELPPAPKWLPRGARAVWRRVGADLVRYGILSGLDLDLFAHYCVAVDLARRAAVELGEDPITVEQLVAARKDGDPVTQTITRPAFKGWREAIAELRRLAGEFGLTPAVRASVKLPAGGEGKAEESDVARLLS
jgi:P27 family predicted phage terminase small subunit